MEGWEQIVTGVKDQAQRMHEGRELGLSKSRALIQASSKCIRFIHRRQFQEAHEMLESAKAIAAEGRIALKPHPELYYAGFLQDAEKELVEAAGVLAMIQNTPIPTPDELQVGPMSYLNGMGEAASEVRRYCLDDMRSGDLASAESILEKMETIYEDLISFDFPDGMTGGLRRTCDALRAVLERTRSDLTATASQQALVRELRAFRKDG